MMKGLFLILLGSWILDRKVNAHRREALEQQSEMENPGARDVVKAQLEAAAVSRRARRLYERFIERPPSPSVLPLFPRA